MIRTLHDTVDRFFANAMAAAPDQFACRPGCVSCCLVDLSVFPIEAAVIEAAFTRLAPEIRAAAADRADRGIHCCMIDPETGNCVVYAARPIICRSHGLTVLVDGRTDHCPLNYTTAPAARVCTLDLEKLNSVLVAVNAASGGDAERTRIAGIAIRNR